MIEAQQGEAPLGDVDLGTFLRFVQWLYHGYYDAAKPSQIRQPKKSQDDVQNVQPDPFETYPDRYANIEDLSNETNLGSWHHSEVGLNTWGHSGFNVNSWGRGEIDSDSWGRSSKSKSKKKGKGTESGVSPPPVLNLASKAKFVQRQYTIRNASKDNPQPRPNTHHEEDYSEVFLGHARLYVFADKYDIEKLKVLAMEELHATLAVFSMYQQRTGDIIALLRYIYANTAETKSGADDLRSLMTDYIETEVESLIGNKDLEGLMSEDATMLADIMEVVRRRFAVSFG